MMCTIDLSPVGGTASECSPEAGNRPPRLPAGRSPASRGPAAAVAPQQRPPAHAQHGLPRVPESSTRPGASCPSDETGRIHATAAVQPGQSHSTRFFHGRTCEGWAAPTLVGGRPAPHSPRCATTAGNPGNKQCKPGHPPSLTCQPRGRRCDSLPTRACQCFAVCACQQPTKPLLRARPSLLSGPSSSQPFRPGVKLRPARSFCFSCLRHACRVRVAWGQCCPRDGPPRCCCHGHSASTAPTP